MFGRRLVDLKADVVEEVGALVRWVGTHISLGVFLGANFASQDVRAFKSREFAYRSISTGRLLERWLRELILSVGFA